MKEQWKTVEFCTNGRNYYQDAVLVIYPAKYPIPHNRNSFWVYATWDISYSTQRNLDGNNKHGNAYRAATYYAAHHTPPKYSFDEAKKAHESVIRNTRKQKIAIEKSKKLFAAEWEKSPLTTNLQNIIKDKSIAIVNKDNRINELSNFCHDHINNIKALKKQIEVMDNLIESLTNELSLAIQKQKPGIIAPLTGTLTKNLEIGVVATGSKIEYKTDNGIKVGTISKRMMPGGFDYMFKTGFYLMDNGDKIKPSDITKLLKAYVGVSPLN